MNKPNLFEAAIALDSALNSIDCAEINLESKKMEFSHEQLDLIRRDLWHAITVINKKLAQDISIGLSSIPHAH